MFPYLIVLKTKTPICINAVTKTNFKKLFKILFLIL